MQRNTLEQGENQLQTQPVYDTGPESNPGNIGGRRGLSPLLQCSCLLHTIPLLQVQQGLFQSRINSGPTFDHIPRPSRGYPAPLYKKFILIVAVLHRMSCHESDFLYFIPYPDINFKTILNLVC